MTRSERNRKLKKILDEGVDGWMRIYEQRMGSGSYGPTPAETVPEAALTVLTGHALLSESRVLKWLTLVLAILTGALTVLTAVLVWRTFL